MNHSLSSTDDQYSDALLESDPESNTVVLQPQTLKGNEGSTFYQTVEKAIETSAAVIIDLLWVDQLETETLKPLATAFLNAQTKGRSLTFLGMDPATRMKFDQITQQSHGSDRSGGYGVFAPEFEAFLEQHRQVKAEAALR